VKSDFDRGKKGGKASKRVGRRLKKKKKKKKKNKKNDVAKRGRLGNLLTKRKITCPPRKGGIAVYSEDGKVIFGSGASTGGGEERLCPFRKGGEKV